MLEPQLRRQILAWLTGAMDAKSREQLRVGSGCVEYLIRGGAQINGAQGVSAIIKDMMDMGFLNKIMENLRNAWYVHEITGSNKKAAKLSTVAEGDYLAILARLALTDPTIFVDMLSLFGLVEEVHMWLLSEWFSYHTSMGHPARQKLYLLGLSPLLELSSPTQEIVLSRLQDYFDMWITVVMELQEGNPGGPDMLLGPQEEATEYDKPKMITERQMKATDPIHTVELVSLVQERLQDLIGRVGGEAAFK